MKTKLVCLFVVLALFAALSLPAWARAQDGGEAPVAEDTLAPYKDWLWGILDQGVRVTGGTECATDADGVQRCSFDFTLRWAE